MHKERQVCFCVALVYLIYLICLSIYLSIYLSIFLLYLFHLSHTSQLTCHLSFISYLSICFARNVFVQQRGIFTAADRSTRGSTAEVSIPSTHIYGYVLSIYLIYLSIPSIYLIYLPHIVQWSPNQQFCRSLFHSAPARFAAASKCFPKK